LSALGGKATWALFGEEDDIPNQPFNNLSGRRTEQLLNVFAAENIPIHAQLKN
jgi:hypothetical protein